MFTPTLATVGVPANVAVPSPLSVILNHEGKLTPIIVSVSP